MKANRTSSVRWLGVVVAAHLAISFVHGSAHGGAGIPMGFLANLFVFGVILAGPPAGLALAWSRPGPGSRVIAATMTASLVFGVVNHFVFEGADRVDHVALEWQRLFGTTAVLLAVTEALGAGLALRVARRMQVRTV
jgi:hypothetical protein